MKKTALVFAILISIPTFAQSIKLLKTTMQKLNYGTGGASINYVIEFKKKFKKKIVIDSVVSIASSKKVMILVSKINTDGKTENSVPENKIFPDEVGIFHIYFGHTLEGPRCKGCGRVQPEQFDFSKGIIIYYHAASKNKKVKIAKFTELSRIDAP